MKLRNRDKAINRREFVTTASAKTRAMFQGDSHKLSSSKQ
jgi:hypothetical protein